MTNNYRYEEKKVNGDTWGIHYLRLDRGIVKITCELMRPNRKFWQSKALYSDWTVCNLNKVTIIRSLADNVITNYYYKQSKIKELNDFFEK